MARKSKEIIWPHLNNCNGDMAKDWYVEYTIQNPATGKKERNRIYDGFKELSSAEERYAYAETIIKEYTDKLNSGWRPWKLPMIEYEDVLAYKNSKTFAPKTVMGSSLIKPLFEDYIKWKKPLVAESSLEDYRSKLRQFSLYLEEKKLLDKDLTFYNNVLIIEFLRTLSEDRDLARKTILQYQQVIFDFFNFLKKIKKINVPNPIEEDMPRFGKIVDMAPAAMPEHIRNRLQKAIEHENPQLWLACCFVYYTAIRPGTELRLMKIKQINFEARTITVINEISKNKRTETVDMPNELHRIIVDEWQLHKYDSEMFVFGPNGKPGAQPLGENTMRERFNKYRDRLNLPKDIKYYSWKHSGAQELAIAGVNTYELQRHLRHRELATTESYLRKRIGQRSDSIRNNFPAI